MKHLCTELLQTMLARVKDLRSAILPGRLKMPRLSSASYFSTFSNQTEALEKPLANERVGCIEN